MSKKIVDLVIHMDGLMLNDGESVDDVIAYLEDKYPLPYDYIYEVTYEEIIDD